MGGVNNDAVRRSEDVSYSFSVDEAFPVTGKLWKMTQPIKQYKLLSQFTIVNGKWRTSLISAD